MARWRALFQFPRKTHLPPPQQEGLRWCDAAVALPCPQHQRERRRRRMSTPDPLAEALAPSRGMDAECAALMREFPGNTIRWTSSRGFRLDEAGRDEPLYCQSRSALLCHLLRHQASR